MQRAKGLASDGDAMRIEVATNQAPAAVVESRQAQRHAVATAQIHNRPRSQVFDGQQSKDAIEPQLPPNEPAVSPTAASKRLSNKTNTVSQAWIRGRVKLDHNRRDGRPGTASN